MRIAILGFGREGRAIFKYLKKNKAYKNASISILDKDTSPDYLKNLTSFDLVFRSPGIPYNSRKIQTAVKAGVKFSSATKIFFYETPCRVIGVTGTKGKGTTSTLIYKIFKAAGYDAHLAGNIGRPAIEILPKLKKSSIAILELSSFQLHDLHKSPHTGVILDIFPDHLDSHDGFADYFQAKTAISRHQTAKDKIFHFADNKYSIKMARLGQGRKISIDTNASPRQAMPTGKQARRIYSPSEAESDSAESRGYNNLFSPEDLKIPGPHNFKNALMAASVARAFGIPKSVIAKTVKNFRGLPHRLEFTKKIIIPLIRANEGNDKSKISGVIKFYNDSASTNPQTTAAAIRAFSEPIILIAGGRDKNLDYTPLARAVRESKNLKAVILFGENKNKIAGHLSPEPSRGVTLKITDDLKTAVSLAYKQSIKLKNLKTYKLINLVFSPGAASFDMFRDYADRGEKFKEIVKNLK